MVEFNLHCLYYDALGPEDKCRKGSLCGLLTKGFQGNGRLTGRNNLLKLANDTMVPERATAGR